MKLLLIQFGTSQAVFIAQASKAQHKVVRLDQQTRFFKRGTWQPHDTVVGGRKALSVRTGLHEHPILPGEGLQLTFECRRHTEKDVENLRGGWLHNLKCGTEVLPAPVLEYGWRLSRSRQAVPFIALTAHSTAGLKERYQRNNLLQRTLHELVPRCGKGVPINSQAYD